MSAVDRDLRALRQWKLRAEGVMLAAGQILREWDTASDESVYSGATEEILGILPHELGGGFETWVELIHPDDRAAYRKEIQRVLVDGGPFEAEVRIRKHNRRHRQILERGYFITPGHGGSAVLTSVINDVTELREMESRLKQSQRVEAFSQLTGGVAHDFNNMLSVVIGYTQLMLEENATSPGEQGFLREIEKAALRASSLTNQLLAFSRPAPVRRGNLAFNELLAEVVKMLKRLLGEQIELVIEPGDALPPVQADRSQIEQVLINLAVALREAMPDGGQLVISTRFEIVSEALSIRDTVVPPGSYVVARITHTPVTCRSAGKPLEKHKAIGTSAAIISENEGHLAVSPDRDSSTRVELFLPTAADPRAATDAGAPERISHSCSILLVEDDSSMRQFAKTVLTRVGHHILEAEDGLAALATLRGNPAFQPDLVIADMVMPRMGGLELVLQLKEQLPEARFLLISGYPDQQTLAEKKRSAAAFLKKPFAVGELISMVGNILETTRDQQ